MPARESDSKAIWGEAVVKLKKTTYIPSNSRLLWHEMHTYIHTHIYTHIYTKTYTYIHIHTLIYTYMHTYINTHIHYIYTHIHIWSSWSYITNIRIAKLTFIGTESSFKSLKRLFKLKTPILVCPVCDNKSSSSGQQKFLTVPAVRRVQTMVQRRKNVSLAKFKIEVYNHQS